MKKFENSVRHYSPESASQIIRESDFEFVTAPMNTVIDVIILRFEPNSNIQDKQVPNHFDSMHPILGYGDPLLRQQYFAFVETYGRINFTFTIVAAYFIRIFGVAHLDISDSFVEASAECWCSLVHRGQANI